MCEECWGGEETDLEALNEAAGECVSAGIAWLDQNGPANWRELIDLGTLDIDYSMDCVLGQVFADKACNPDFIRVSGWGEGREYSSGYDYAVETLLGGHYSDTVTGPLGFSGYDDTNAGIMTDAWIRALAS